MSERPPLPGSDGWFAEYVLGVVLGMLVPVLAVVFGVMAGTVTGGMVAMIAMYGGAVSFGGRRGFRALGLASGFTGLVVGGPILLTAMVPDAKWGL